MKKIFVVFIILTFILLGCSKKEGDLSQHLDSQKTESHPSFPRYNFSQLIEQGKTDLVVLAKVVSVAEIKGNDPSDPEGSHQEAILKIEDIVFGNVQEETVKLYQSTERVLSNKKYVLYLSYRDQIKQYVVSDGNSQMEVNGNKVVVRTLGIEGEYETEKFKEVFKEKVEMLKSK